MSGEQRALLSSDRAAFHGHVNGSDVTAITIAQRQTKRYLTSKTGHYSVLLLVSLDISCIFADFIIQLLTCEGRIPGKDSNEAEKVLGIVSLVFSCLFMTELIASIWAFGWQYFQSRFHCFDAFIIIVGFVVDVILKGVLEEIGSLVVVLRLWRVFKIIEELSAGAADQMEALQERLDDLEKDNAGLRTEVQHLKMEREVGG